MSRVIRKYLVDILSFCLAVYCINRFVINRFYSDPEEDVVERVVLTEAAVTKSEHQLVQNAILQKHKKRLYNECDDRSCYTVYDKASVPEFTLQIRRYLVDTSTSPRQILSISEVEVPKVLTWSNKDSSKWKVHKLVLVERHLKVAVAAAFFTQALTLSEYTNQQEVLILGVAGGQLATFLAQMEHLQIHTTDVESDEHLLKLSRKYFSYNESNAVIQKGTDFIEKSVNRGQKFNVVFVTECLHGICPREEYLQPEVVQNLANITFDQGACIIPLSNQENFSVFTLFSKYFASCFLFQYDFDQILEVLVCTHRQNWTWTSQLQLFKENFRDVDDTFDLQIFHLFTNF